MSLTSILLFATSVLAVLSGFSVLVGASKVDRTRMAWFFVAAMMAALWSVAIALFLALPVGSESVAPVLIMLIYIASAIMMVALLGFASWEYVIGKVLTVSAALAVIVSSAVVLHDTSILFVGFTLTNQGNTVQLVNGVMYWLYTFFFVLNSVLAWFFILQHSRRTRIKRVRQGDYVLLVGLMVTGALSMISDLILPLFVRYDLIWIGPLALSITLVTFYYAILRFRIISISSGWLKTLSYVVLLVSGAVIYMLIFYLIFTALFKIPNPSTSVLVLNFLMIVIVLLLMPLINEVSASMRSMISVGQVDIAYVIKKLNRLAAKNVDLRELAAFLATHLHFAYIGFIINGKLYGSKSLAMSAEEVIQLTHLKPTPRGEVWQEPSKTVQKILDDLDLKAVAELRNAKGKAFGQIVVGKPLGKSSFERRDLIQLEMIINLVATVIDSEKHIRA